MRNNMVPLPGTQMYCTQVQTKLNDRIDTVDGRVSKYVKRFASAMFFFLCTIGGVYIFVWTASGGQDAKIAYNKECTIRMNKDIQYLFKGFEDQKEEARLWRQEQRITQKKVLEEIRELKTQ